MNVRKQVVRLIPLLVFTFLITGTIAMAQNPSPRTSQLIFECQPAGISETTEILSDLTKIQIFYNPLVPSTVTVTAHYQGSPSQLLNLDTTAYLGNLISIPSPERLNGKSHFTISKVNSQWRLIETSAETIRYKTLECRETP